MKAKVKDLHSPDIFDLESFVPKDNSQFCFLLQVLVGPENELGDETFDITVCTPKWLTENYKTDEVLFLRHHLIVFEYNYNRIVEALKKKIQNLSAENWRELALKVSRIGYWEFEDYQEKS